MIFHQIQPNNLPNNRVLDLAFHRPLLSNNPNGMMDILSATIPNGMMDILAGPALGNGRFGTCARPMLEEGHLSHPITFYIYYTVLVLVLNIHLGY